MWLHPGGAGLGARCADDWWWCAKAGYIQRAARLERGGRRGEGGGGQVICLAGGRDLGLASGLVKAGYICCIKDATEA